VLVRNHEIRRPPPAAQVNQVRQHRAAPVEPIRPREDQPQLLGKLRQPRGGVPRGRNQHNGVGWGSQIMVHSKNTESEGKIEKKKYGIRRVLREIRSQRKKSKKKKIRDSKKKFKKKKKKT
jgi:hypothetical protein